jgi:hypothetical protein
VKREWVMASVLLAIVGESASGGECAGIAFADQIQAHGESLTLNGLGAAKTNLLRISVYVAALYLTEPSSDPNEILQPDTPSELVLEFTRAVSANQLRKGWEEGFAKNTPGHPPGLEEGLRRLNSWVTNVTAGQRLTFIRIPGTGMQVEFDGTVIGTIQGNEFSRALLSIWLGGIPQSPELKSALLGEPCR